MEGIPGMAAGAIIGSVATEAFEKVRDKATEQVQGKAPQHDGIESEILVHLVSNIEKIIREAKESNCPPDMRTIQLQNITLNGMGTQIKRRGYKHVSLLCAAAVNLSVVTAIGTIAFAMTVGWNPFDLPDGVTVYIASGGANYQNVIVYWGDDMLDMSGV